MKVNSQIAIVLAVTLLLGLLVFLYKKPDDQHSFKKPTSPFKLRGCDPMGCGHFEAPRGNHLHQGVDIQVDFGDTIVSPISGKVTRHPYPYSGNFSLHGIEVTGTGEYSGYVVKIFYLSPLVSVEEFVVAGQKIGEAQDVASYYGDDMINHIHLELYENQTSINPLNFI